MTERNITAANKVLPKTGLNGFNWTFLQSSSSVVRLNFVLKIPAFGNTQTFTSNYILKYADNYEAIIAIKALSGNRKYFSAGVSMIATEYFNRQ